MKKILYLAIMVVFCTSCADEYETIHTYSRIITQSKAYPVYLDMSEISNIQVYEEALLENPFKVISNDDYYFVGDMLKGIFVFDKNDTKNHLCFIECKYIKDLEIINNHLFCNNFTDLVILDVSNPLKTDVLHREKYHFNRFKKSVEHWNIPYVKDKGLIVGFQHETLTGTVTDKQPQLDFTEYDNLYGNLTSTEIPDSWISSKPEEDKPYMGIVKVGPDKIFTLGNYNSWAICTYDGERFSVVEKDLWATPKEKYGPPYYYANAHPVKLLMKDDVLCVLGKMNYSTDRYIDCIMYHDSFPVTYGHYVPGDAPIDAIFLPDKRAFFALLERHIRVLLMHDDPVATVIKSYKDYAVSSGAEAIMRAENKFITLGDKLSVYESVTDDVRLLKEYPDISGACYLKEKNILTIAKEQGLFMYDISDLENIKPL